MTRVLLFGKDGQIGWELQRVLPPYFVVFPFGRQEVDISCASAVQSVMHKVQPDTIINAAAYTAVDRAERDERTAFAVNSAAPEVLATAAKSRGALLVHYSSDYVFDGLKSGLYSEDDVASPLGVYGKSKRLGEVAVEASGCDFLIFRTSWVYGARSRNFLLTMLRLANREPELRVVDDQVGVPNWSRMIAQITLGSLLAVRERSRQLLGTYHLSTSGQTSWHGFAAAIVALGSELGLCPAVPVVPIATADYPTPSKRPANSALSNARLQSTFGLRLPDWHTCLRWCMEDLAAATTSMTFLKCPSSRSAK